MSRRRIARRGEEGIALLVVLFFAIIALGYSASALTSVLSVRQQSRYFNAEQRAHDAAESGVHQTLARLGTFEGADLRAGGNASGTLMGTGNGAIRYDVVLTPAGDDGADNDQDGRVDEADESNLLELRSTGHCDRVARTVRVTLLARYRKMDVGAATYLSDPNAAIGLNGNSFLISGFDHDLKGNEIGGSVPGIGVPGSPEALIKQIKAKAAAKVVGSGGVPSVNEVAPLDLQDLIEEGARAASVELPAGTTVTKLAEGAWGTIASPTVVYSPGSIHISGNAAGAGILIINGDLQISGSFQWLGLIVVRGEVVFTGGGSGKRLNGALIVEKDIRSEDRAKLSETLTVSGTVDILFSNQAIEHVMRSFATYTLLNWREGPNPDEE